MRLIHCHIENFGSLHRMDIDFNQGLHVICEDNGWGKSTLSAFIRAMFYGLAGENRRQVTTNERMRYAPWQGGVFGGSLTFRIDDRTYILTRRFGDASLRRKGDFFELRDAETNRPSTDYTENIGEEIFHVNRESFMNTLYIRQNHCTTSATDDIHTMIGHLTDHTDDMNNYESAQAQIQAELNRLNPHRVTGSLHRRQERIQELRYLLDSSRNLDAMLDSALAEHKQKEQLLAAETAARTELNTVWKQVISAQTALAQRKELDDRKHVLQQAEENLRTCRSHFPGNVPSAEAVRSQLRTGDTMNRAAERCRSYRLSSEEQQQIQEGRSVFGDSVPDPQELESYRKQAVQLMRLRRDQSAFSTASRSQGSSSSRGGGNAYSVLPVWAPGLILLMAGLCLAVLFPALRLPGILLAVFGAGLSAYRFVRSPRNTAIDPHSSLSDDIGRYLERYHQSAAEDDYLDELYRLREMSRNYTTLCEQLRRYQEAEEQYQASRTEIIRFLRQLSIDPKENLTEQLQDILSLSDDCEDAFREYRSAQRDLEELQEQTDLDLLQSADELKKLPSSESLEEQQELLEVRYEGAKQDVQRCRERIRQLREALDQREEQQDELSRLSEQQDEETLRLRHLELAARGLTQAREALAVRYADPVYEAFCRYYSLIAEDDPREFHLDTDIAVTRDILGSQRSSVTLSRGQQDLIGFCLRIALVEVMYPDEAPVLILDDPFINLDDQKLAQAKILLEELERTYQILYFTCSQARS